MKACPANLEPKGRLVRALAGLALFAAALGWLKSSPLGASLLAVAGAFALFEAARGWCLLRACGIKTRF